MSSVSDSRTEVGEKFELVVAGEVEPQALKSLNGFAIVREDNGRTHMAGRVYNQAHLFDLLWLIGDSGIHLVSLTPESG